jgi:hypothetical protein
LQSAEPDTGGIEPVDCSASDELCNNEIAKLRVKNMYVTQCHLEQP